MCQLNGSLDTNTDFCPLLIEPGFPFLATEKKKGLRFLSPGLKLVECTSHSKDKVGGIEDGWEDWRIPSPPSPACVEVSQEEQGVPAGWVVQSPSLLQREQQGIFCSCSMQNSTAPHHIPPRGWGQRIPKTFRAATLPHTTAKRISSVRADTKLWSSCSKGTDYCNMSHGEKK